MICSSPKESARVLDLFQRTSQYRNPRNCSSYVFFLASYLHLIFLSERVVSVCQMERCLPLFIVFKSLYSGRLLFLEILFSLYYFPVGPTSLLEIIFSLYYFPVRLNSLLEYSSIVQLSSFDFLESSSLRKFV
jgi:hypothetical protein